MDKEFMKTCSIQLRLKRTIIEDAYVSVLVTDSLLKENEDGNTVIDFEKFTKEAIALGENSEVDWQIESSVIEAHSIQRKRLEERKLFDSFYLLKDKEI